MKSSSSCVILFIYFSSQILSSNAFFSVPPGRTNRLMAAKNNSDDEHTTTISRRSRSRSTNRQILMAANNDEELITISTSRRDIFLSSSAAVIASSFCVHPSNAQTLTTSGIERVEGIGGGLDLLSPNPLSYSEVFYPNSMINSKWKVQRVITSVEGDLGQAALAWQLLGGSSDERAFTSKLTEVYESTFTSPPTSLDDAKYEYEGKILQAAILDRGSELSSRTGVANDTIQWDVKSNSISYARNKDDNVNLTIVRRNTELPTDQGFGFDEICRIESSAGGIFSGTNVYRAARVRRRYRRGFDETTGQRILDAIEVVTTHRVLDGIAGIELPTSTTKSRLRYTQI